MTLDLYSSLRLRSGKLMPVLGLGTWLLTQNTAEVVGEAINLGYRLIDTSSDYETQPSIGRAITNSQIQRDQLFITTKVEETDDAFLAAKEYVGEMNLEQANLILIHRPPQTGVGIELWQGLIKAKKEGVTLDIGVSNYAIDQISTLVQETGEVPAVNQIEWSPFGYSQEMAAYCAQQQIVIQAYSPLTRTTHLTNNTLIQIAENYNKTPAQILIRWNLQNKTVPIPKANQLKHLKENIDVFDFEITGEDMDILNQLNKQYSVFGTLPYV